MVRQTQTPIDVALEPPRTLERDPQATIELLDAGDTSDDSPASAAKEFIFTPSLGNQPTVTVTYNSSSEVLVDGISQESQDLPERRALLAQEVVPDVNGAQRATITFQELAPTVADTGLDELLASGKGFAVTFQRAANGAISATTLEAPIQARNVARQSVEQIAGALADSAVVLPAEIIGTGARWTVTQPIQDAVAPEMVVTYTLKRIDGNSLLLGVSGEAAQQEDFLTGDAETRLAVQKYSSTLTGEIKLSLTEAVPFFGTLTYQTTAQYRADDGAITETSNTRELHFS